MFKIIGALLIICSGTAYGYTFSVRLSDKVVFIKKYMEFILFIEREIKYNQSDLLYILNTIESKGNFYIYINKCREYLDMGYVFSDAWKKSFSGASKEVGILKDCEEAIIDFGLGLGTNSIETQISHCKYYYESAKVYFNDLIKEKKEKSRLYIILGICFSIALVLLFV